MARDRTSRQALMHARQLHPPADVSVVHIRANRGWAALGLGELWRYREVAIFLAWRDIQVRYKQTIFGAAWAILQPFVTMVIFSIIFGRIAKMPSDGIPYPIFSYAALVPWTFFAASVDKGSNSLVGNAGIVTRIYFPRLAMPLAATLGNVVDFVLAFIVLLAMMVYFGVAPTVNVIWLPLLLLLAMVAALGVSFVLAAMNVQFRDVKYAVPFMLQSWMFVTPVVYPASLIEDPFWQALYALNPMVGVIEGFRWALLGTDTAPGLSIIVSSLVASVVFVAGAFYFKRMERTFADVV
jgi:lipopolysaccharide transport system permease protein